MTWITLWMQTLFGRREKMPYASDPDLARAHQIKREQENRLLLIEQEAESLRLPQQHKGRT